MLLCMTIHNQALIYGKRESPCESYDIMIDKS